MILIAVLRNLKIIIWTMDIEKLEKFNLLRRKLRNFGIKAKVWKMKIGS